jgi:lipid-A-disaccharide synthase
MRETAIMGLTEVIGSIRRVLSLRKNLAEMLETLKPAALVLIDSPDFNFPLAKRATELNIPTIYYICPQLWAWREGRINFLAKYTSRRAVIFPFEKDYYSERGVEADFVGHPLFDEIAPLTKEEARVKLNLDLKGKVLALFPGSRKKIFARVAPVMLKAAYLLAKDIKDLKILVPIAASLPDSYMRDAISKYDEDFRLRFDIHKGRSQEILKAADCAILTSGTSVMEGTIIGTPMVVAYKTSALSFFLAKILVKVKYASLTNIMADRELIPEFLQDRATPENLASAAIPYFYEGSSDRRRLLSDLALIKDSLGGPGASQAVLDIILEETQNVGRDGE